LALGVCHYACHLKIPSTVCGLCTSTNAFVARKKKRTGQKILERFKMNNDGTMLDLRVSSDPFTGQCKLRTEQWSLMVVSEMVRMQGREASVAGHVNGGGWQPVRGERWQGVMVG
jgi:hypothetical protein